MSHLRNGPGQFELWYPRDSATFSYTGCCRRGCHSGRILNKNVSELQEEPDESVELEVLADRRQNSELRAPTDREVLNAR